MKRVLSLLLIICLTFSLVACGSTGNTSSTDDSSVTGSVDSVISEGDVSTDTEASSADSTVSVGSSTVVSTVTPNPNKFKGKTLTFWSHWDMTEFLEDAQAFMDKTGVTIKAENVATYEDYSGKISTAISANSGPDCFWMYPNMVPAWAKAGMLKSWDDLVDINAEPYKSKISKPTLDMYKYNNKHYGIYKSDETTVFVIYYNKAMFAASGIEDPYSLYQKGQWTWAKFSEISEQMCYDSDSDGVNDTFAFSGSTGNVLTSWLIANGANEVIYANGKPKFGLTEPAAIEALKMYYKAIEYGGTNSGASTESDFLNEKIAMYLEGSYYVKQYLEKMGDNLGIVPMPKGPNAKNKMNNRLGSVPFGISANCKNTELLAHFMDYYFSKEDSAKKKAELEKMWKGKEEMRDFLKSMYSNGAIANAAAFGNLGAITNGKIYSDINMGADAATVVKAYANQAQSIIDESMK